MPHSTALAALQSLISIERQLYALANCDLPNFSTACDDASVRVRNIIDELQGALADDVRYAGSAMVTAQTPRDAYRARTMLNAATALAGAAA